MSMDCVCWWVDLLHCSQFFCNAHRMNEVGPGQFSVGNDLSGVNCGDHASRWGLLCFLLSSR